MELATNRTLNDVIIILSERGRYFIIGSRFQDMCKTEDPNVAYDFFNNYACLFDYDEMSHAWKCYKKARAQRMDSVRNAFWNYIDGKSIRMISVKHSVFEWISKT